MQIHKNTCKNVEKYMKKCYVRVGNRTLADWSYENNGVGTEIYLSGSQTSVPIKEIKKSKARGEPIHYTLK